MRRVLSGSGEFGQVLFIVVVAEGLTWPVLREALLEPITGDDVGGPFPSSGSRAKSSFITWAERLPWEMIFPEGLLGDSCPSECGQGWP